MGTRNSSSIVLHQIPSLLARELGRTQRSLQAGFDSQKTSCWFLSKSTISLWPVATESAQIITHNLLYSHQPTVRSTSYQASSTLIYALAVTSLDGNITLWTDFVNVAEPLQMRVPGTVTAVSPLMLCTLQGTPTLVLFVSTADGQIHAVQVAQPTMTQDIEVHVLQPAPPTPVHTGLVGALVRGIARAVAAGAGHRPSGQPSVHLSAVVEGQQLILMSATASTLELWKIQLQDTLACPHPMSCTHLSSTLPRTTLMAASDVVAADEQTMYMYVVVSDGVGASPTLCSVSIAVEDGGVQLRGQVDVQGVQAQQRLGVAMVDGDVGMVWTRGGGVLAVDIRTGHQWSVWPRALDVTVDDVDQQVVVLDRHQGIVSTTLAPHAHSPSTHMGARMQSGAAAAALPSGAAAGVSTGTTPADTNTTLEALDAAVAGLIPPAALAGRVGGALSALGPSNPLVMFVAGVVDALPKQVGAAVDITAQLGAKAARHAALVEVLQQSGLLVGLHAEVLRLLFESGEQLAAVAAIRDLENRFRERAEHAAADALHALVDAAGAACRAQQATGAMAGSDELAQRPAWELFYCMPTISASAFFMAAATSLDAAQPPQLDTVQLHKTAVHTALRAALQQLHRYQSRLGPHISRAQGEVPRPDWSVSLPIRTALVALVNACSVLTASSSGEVHVEAAGKLLECTEQLLNTFAAALAALPPGQGAQLHTEYTTLRDRMLTQLLGVAQQSYTSTASDAALQAVESLAEAHQGYAQLWEVCRVLGDEERLHQHMGMLQEQGRGGFAQYVFARYGSLAKHHEWQQLLSFPDQFNQPLLEWLKHHSAAATADPELCRVMSLHQLRCHEYLPAADSGVAYVTHTAAPVPIDSAHRALCLAKLAAGAAPPPHSATLPPSAAQRAVAADQQLALLATQRTLQPDATTRLPPEQLLQAALDASSRDPGGGPAAMQAVAVFAAAPPAFAQEHGHVLEPVWRRVAKATDWTQVAAQRAQCGDRAFDALLAQQPLSQAAAMLYGPYSAVDGGAGAVLSREQVLETVLGEVPAVPMGAREVARAAFALGAGVVA